MFNALTSDAGDEAYILPDQRKVKIEGHARFISPEIFFSPEVNQSD